MKNIIKIIIILLTIIPFSCTKKSLEPDLEQNQEQEGAITTVDDLSAFLLGAYNRMTDYRCYGRNVQVYGDVRSDNCVSINNSNRFHEVASMDLIAEDDRWVESVWRRMYNIIANTNIVIANANLSVPSSDVELRDHIVGQAYAIRALTHFDLLKLYGQMHVTGQETVGIPYITEYKPDDPTPARETVANCRTLIQSDLSSARSLLSPNFNNSDYKQITTYAINAIRARIALYFGDWDTVKTECESIINAGIFSVVGQTDFPGSWTADTPPNAIFQLAFSGTDNQGINGFAYIFRGFGYGDVRLTPDLYGIFSPGDVRVSTDMIDIEGGHITNFGKWPSADYSDNVVLFRYEELILNYAEALYELNNSDQNALTYLNMIPGNRGTSIYVAPLSKDNFLLERRKELCCEGFRFDDLTRNRMDIPFYGPPQTHGGPTYGSYNYALPIPQYEINANPDITQNYGY